MSEPSSEAQTNPQMHSQSQCPPSKPVLILIYHPTHTIDLIASYGFVISNLERDAHIIFANGLTHLQRILADDSMAELICGFIVTNAKVMAIDGGDGGGREVENGDGEAQTISGLLTEIVKGVYSFHHEEGNTNANIDPDQPASSRYPHRTIHPHEWTVLFAFEFPAQAALQPLRFKNHISDTFGTEIGWKICGATKNEWTLKINGAGLRIVGGGVYRGN